MGVTNGLQQGEDALRFVLHEEHFGNILVNGLGSEGWRAMSCGLQDQ